MEQTTTTATSRWSDRGLLATAVGASVGATASMAVAVPLANWASDAENGWSHDANGWLLVPAALAAWAGTILGAAVGVRLAGRDRAGSTATWAVVTLPVVVIVLVALTLPARTWLAAPGLAGVLARIPASRH